MSTEFRIPDANRGVRISDKVLGELAEQSPAVVRAFLAAVEEIAQSPPPEERPCQLVEHPWCQWAAAHGLEDPEIGR